MVRHATSHGFSVLMCIIISEFLIEVIRPVFPQLIFFSEGISENLVNFFHLPFSIQEFNRILIASLLAIFWGVFFKLQSRKFYTDK